MCAAHRVAVSEVQSALVQSVNVAEASLKKYQSLSLSRNMKMMVRMQKLKASQDLVVQIQVLQFKYVQKGLCAYVEEFALISSMQSKRFGASACMYIKY